MNLINTLLAPNVILTPTSAATSIPAMDAADAGGNTGSAQSTGADITPYRYPRQCYYMNMV